MKNHPKSPLQEQKLKCSKHQTGMEFFCFTCDFQLCPSCLSDLHKNHEFDVLKKAGLKIKQSIIEEIDIDNRKKLIMEKIQINDNKQAQIKKKLEILEIDEKNSKVELKELDQKYQTIQNLSYFQEIYN